MPADPNKADVNELAVLFAQYGVELFLEATSLLVTLLDKDGRLLSWNSAFDLLRRNQQDKQYLKDFLQARSQTTFERLLATTLQKRIRAKGELEFVGEAWNERFIGLFIPMPEQRILFIAEPVSLASTLEDITRELERTKRILNVRETELKAVIAQAEEVSHTDALTLIPNRRQIMGDLQREVMFADRYGTPLTISMLDVDHFKRINDTYGHGVGDEVLRSLATELRSHIRYPDTIGRYGGEEFLIVLPHSTIEAASRQAERLCSHVRSTLIKCREPGLAVTISIGIAQYRVRKEDWETFLDRADAALYRAKHNGRDQWVAAEE